MVVQPAAGPRANPLHATGSRMITVAARDEDCLVGAQILYTGQLVGIVESAHVACMPISDRFAQAVAVRP